MDIPTWPVTLPIKPQRTNYQEQYQSLAQSVTTGNKSLLVRKNSSRTQDKITVTYVLSKEQIKYFNTFYYDTLAGGVLRFSYQHPRTGETIEVSFDPTQSQSFTIAPFERSLYYSLTMTLIIWS